MRSVMVLSKGSVLAEAARLLGKLNPIPDRPRVSLAKEPPVDPKRKLGLAMRRRRNRTTTTNTMGVMRVSGTARGMSKVKEPEAQEGNDDDLQNPQRSAGKGVAGALAEDDAQVESALHDDGIGETRADKEREQDGHGKQEPRKGSALRRQDLSERVETTRSTSTGPRPSSEPAAHHSQPAAGIARGGGNGEELAPDRGDEDTQGNRGEDVCREFQRIACGKIRSYKTAVVKPTVLKSEVEGNDRDLRNDEGPFDPWVSGCRYGSGLESGC